MDIHRQGTSKGGQRADFGQEVFPEEGFIKGGFKDIFGGGAGGKLKRGGAAKFMPGAKYGPPEPPIASAEAVGSGESLYRQIMGGTYPKAGSVGTIQSATSGGQMYYDPIANMWKTPTSLKSRIQSNATSQTTVGSTSALLPKFVGKKMNVETPRTWEGVKPKGGAMEAKFANPAYEPVVKRSRRDLDLGSSSGSLAPPKTAPKGKAALEGPIGKAPTPKATTPYNPGVAEHHAEAAARHAQQGIGPAAAGSNPNPYIHRFGARYNALPEYKQFLAKKGLVPKAKFLAKRGAYEIAKGLAGGAVVGGVAGGVSGSINYNVYQEHEKRTRAIMKELEGLSERIKTQQLHGTPYSTSYVPPVSTPLPEPPQYIPLKKSKQVTFEDDDDGPNRFVNGDWW